MKCQRWLFFATVCMTAIAAGGDLAESEDDASFTELISSHENSREAPSDGETSRDAASEASRDVVGEASRVVAGEASKDVTGETSREKASVESLSRCDDVSTTPRSCSKTNADQLRENVVTLTNQLSKSVATLAIAKKDEEKLALLEREKYCYVKSASDNVMKLVDNVKQAEIMLSADTSREREYQLKIARIHRAQNRAGRRLQVIRRLLAGAEVGMVHLESDWKLNTCNNTC